jgi:hypothetical protein
MADGIRDIDFGSPVQQQFDDLSISGIGSDQQCARPPCRTGVDIRVPAQEERNHRGLSGSRGLHQGREPGHGRGVDITATVRE